MVSFPDQRVSIETFPGGRFSADEELDVALPLVRILTRLPLFMKDFPRRKVLS